MQAAQMQLKTENGEREENVFLRTLRHAVPVLLALLIALLAAAPVLADETGEDGTDTDAVSAEQTEMTESLTDGYVAVAAQLEAVARAEGREMADKMLYGALRSISDSKLTDTDDAETAVVSAVSSAAEPKAVVVNVSASSGTKWSAKGLLPFVAVTLLALLGLSFAVRPMRRRRVHNARAYRPMRDRTLSDTAFQKRAHSSL